MREQLGIGAGAFVFGMVARGIAEKGWGAARTAKVKLSKEKQRKLLRSRMVEFYFDHPELVVV